jgi:hypothetical protein
MTRLALFGSVLMLAVVAAVALPGRPAEAQSQCYQETGFCIENPLFQEYFRVRGGTRILGYPVSRTFTLEGNQVQFFQRVVLQQAGNSVNRLNVLDPDVMPMTHANGSTFPAPDTSLGGPGAIPDPSSPDYADRVIDFVARYSPNTWNGQNVGFFDLFTSTVPIDIAFPGQTPNPGLVTLLNMEIWGVPTSQPTPDPANAGFIYQRFQRGIMHYRAEQNVTEGILVADYLKSVMTLRNLPPDLAEEMRNSRYFGQYDPSVPNWVKRPAELPNTNLTNAFEPGSGDVMTPPPAPVPATAVPGATAATTGPTVSIQVDDDTIDSGDQITITVIARDPRGLEWIAWEGDDTNDGELDREHRFDCNGQTECASVWTVTATKTGTHTLRARAQTTDDVESELASVNVRVREVSATPVPTAAPTSAPTSAPTTAPTMAPTTGPTGVPKP